MFFVFMENIKFIVLVLTIHAEMVSAIGHHPCCTNHHKNIGNGKWSKLCGWSQPEKNGSQFSRRNVQRSK